MTSQRSFRLGGVRLDACSAADVAVRAAAWARARDGRTRTICFVNAGSIFTAGRDELFRGALNRSDLSVSSTRTIAWLGRRLTGAVCDPVGAASLMHALLTHPEFTDLTHLVLGTSQDTLDRLVFRYNLGGLRGPARIVGTHLAGPGEVTSQNEAALLTRLAETRPDILWVCLEPRRQEIWIEGAHERLGVPLVAVVGPAAEILSGDRKQPSWWFQRAGLEGALSPGKE